MWNEGIVFFGGEMNCVRTLYFVVLAIMEPQNVGGAFV